MGWRDRAVKIDAEPTEQTAPVDLKTLPRVKPGHAGGSWRDRATPVAQEAGAGDKLAAGVAGGARGASAGLIDEIAGGAGVVGGKLLGALDYVLPTSMYDTSDDRDLSVEEEYREGRDFARGAEDRAASKAPGIFKSSELAGAIASPTPLGKVKAATLGGKIALGAGRGGITGGLYGAGTSEADLLDGELSEFAGDVAEGSAAGAALGGAIPIAARGAQKAGRAIADKATEIAPKVAKKATEISRDQFARAAGVQNRAMVRKLGGPEKTQMLGQWARDKGIVKAGESLDDVARKATAIRDQSGAFIGEMRKTIQKVGVGPGSPYIRGTLTKLVSQYKKYDNPFAKRLVGIIDDFKRDLAKNTGPDGRVPPKVLEELKGQLDAQLQGFYQGGPGQIPDAVKKLKSATRRVFNKAEERIIKEQLDKSFNVNGKPAIDAFRAAKADYGSAKKVLKAVGYKQEGQSGNRNFGLTDFIIGTGGGVVDPVTGIAAVAVKKAAEKYGNAVTGVAAEKVAKKASGLANRGVAPETVQRVQRVLDAAEKEGPSATAAAGYVLLTKFPELEADIIAEVRRRQARAGRGAGSGPASAPGPAPR